jgi:hypothetical protein
VTVSFEAPSYPAPAAPPHRTASGRVRRTLWAAGRALLYCAALIPLAIGTLIVASSGRARAAVPCWRWLRTRVLGAPSPQVTRRPGFFAVVIHALLSVLLGAAALVPLGIEVLFILRGVLYGLVDHGPYTNSWGGPTRAGAWLAHFLVGVPEAGAGLLALVGIAAIHQRLTLSLDGGRRSLWLAPVTLLVSASGALFFVAWLHQL